MKKLIAMLLLAAMLLSLAACGETKPTESAVSAGKIETETQEAAAVPEPTAEPVADTVTIELPAGFFDGMTEDEIIANAKEEGVLECVIAKDGVVSYTITKEKQAEMIAEMQESLEELKDELLDEAQGISFTDIRFSDDYTAVTVTADPLRYNTMEQMYAYPLYMMGLFCQAFSGTPLMDIAVTVTIVNEENGQVMDERVMNYADEISDPTGFFGYTEIETEEVE